MKPNRSLSLRLSYASFCSFYHRERDRLCPVSLAYSWRSGNNVRGRERETPSLSLRLRPVRRFSGLANAARTKSNTVRVCSTSVLSSFDP